MDFPILIIWMCPFSFLGTSGVFIFHFSMKFVQANRIAQMFRGVTSRDILGRQACMGFKINVLTRFIK